MLKWIYIQIIKRRRRFCNDAYKAAWYNSGADHPATLFWKNRWYNANMKAIQTLEETFK